MNQCPGEETLAAFAGGELSGNALPRVALHAEQCADCALQLTAASAEPAERADAALLSERYKLVRKLGTGGMGVVYEAEDRVLGERVALKLLRGELASDERALEYLKSEVKLSRQISHAHVCRVFDFGTQTASDRTLYYLSMELLRGPSLRSVLAQGALEPGLALRLADQVLCGLQAAHAAGVLHRDLKPDNMLLRHPSPAEPHAVITDFGLARAFQAGQCHVTASRTLVGSAAYLAPEQVQEAPLTEATDLYSFGVVLFELLTGEQPFHGETPLGVALKRLHTPPPRPSAVRPQLDERYDSLVLRCLARDPRERFQSAASARAELKTLLFPAHACACPTPYETGSTTHTPVGPRKPLRLALSALCIGMGASLWLGTKASDTAPSSPAPLTAAQPATPAQHRDQALAQAGSTHALAAESGAPLPEPPRATPAADALRPGSANVVTRRLASSPIKRLPSRVVTTLQAKPVDVLTPDGFFDPFAD